MKRIIPAIICGTMLASSAFAAALSMSGTIKAIDTSKKDIVLQSGETVMLPAKFDMKTIKVGEKVKITYAKQGSQLVASTVQLEK